jgi:hypothetical protein
MRIVGVALGLVLAVVGSSCGGGAPSPVGAACVSGENCQSGHCLSDANGNNRRCTGPCTTSADCPAGAPSCESLGSAPPFEWAAGQMWCVLPQPLAR